MGSTPKIEAPQVDAQETTREAIAAQVESIPDIFAAQQEYGSQFAGLDVANLQQYLPILNQLSRDEQAKNLAFQREQYPETQIAGEKTAEYLQGQDIAGQDASMRGDMNDAIEAFLSGEDPLTSIQKSNIQQDVRGRQIAGGTERFGTAAFEEARSIEDLRRSVRQERLNASLQKLNVQNQLNLQGLNTALSVSGRVPVSSGSQLNFQQPNQLVQNVDPSSVFNTAFNNQNASLQAAQFNAEQVSPLGQIAGQFAGGLGMGIGGMI